jgi:hypothetical protein
MRVFLSFILAIEMAGAALGGVVTKDTPREFPAVTNSADWKERSRLIREQILVDSGLWPMPEKTPLHARVFGKIERDGYSVEKVCFESYPGFWVGGNLYRPRGENVTCPAVLIPHGHWDHGRLEDTAICSTPGLCINLARQGIIAFCYDMAGYNDTQFANTPAGAKVSDAHREFASNNPTAMLWGVSLMGLQTWDSVRALDFITALPDVDKGRIACTGASGGGTQTIILGAIDDRLAAQAPVVMVSHFFQGGCDCENMAGLRVRHSNVEIAAAAAPRPQILVGDTHDWTREMITNEGPTIGGIYELFGEPEKLRYVCLEAEHNYNQGSREAVYRWFDRWLTQKPDEPVTETAFQKEKEEDLRAFAEGDRPTNAVSATELVNYIIEQHKKNLDAMNPTNESSLKNYQTVMKTAWRATLQVDWPMKAEEVTARRMRNNEEFIPDELTIASPGNETLKVVLMSPNARQLPTGTVTVVLASPDGAKAFLDEAGEPRGLARILVDRKIGVAIPEVTARDASPEQTSLFYTTYNRTWIQERVGELMRVCEGVRTIQHHSGRVILAGSGAAGLWCLLAAPAADAVAADCDEVEAAEDTALLGPGLFCPGIRNMDTFEGGPILAAPHFLLLHHASPDFPTEHLKSCYKTLGREERLRIERRDLADQEIAEWIANAAKQDGKRD